MVDAGWMLNADVQVAECTAPWILILELSLPLQLGFCHLECLGRARPWTWAVLWLAVRMLPAQSAVWAYLHVCWADASFPFPPPPPTSQPVPNPG